MLLPLSQFFLRILKPQCCAWLSKFIYCGSRVEIGGQFKTDGLPRFIVDRGASLVIGRDVEFRSGVEIRAHNSARIRIGNNVRIDRGARLLAANAAELIIEDGARIGLGAVLNAGDSIRVGNKSLISGFVYLQTSMHGYGTKERSIQDQGYQHGPIFLSDDVWLGAHVVVLPNVRLGKGVIIGSNSVVTKTFEDYKIAAGCPARLINER